MATGGGKKSATPAAKPAAAKIPAVIAKPSAPAPATKSSGAAPKGGGKAATGSKLVQPTKQQPRVDVPVLDRNMMTAATTPTAGSITSIPQEQLDKYTSLFGKVV